jgi:hypothetical protein
MYAKQRGYKFWKAFTTGKPPVDWRHPARHVRHDDALRAPLRHRDAQEAQPRRGQLSPRSRRAAPTAISAANEILISKDITLAVVDGAGVLYDPNGLNRDELTRLAKARKMTDHFDTSAPQRATASSSASRTATSSCPTASSSRAASSSATTFTSTRAPPPTSSCRAAAAPSRSTSRTSASS